MSPKRLVRLRLRGEFWNLLPKVCAFRFLLLNDCKKLQQLDVPWIMKLLEKQGMKHVRGTYLEQLLRDAKLI